jgi:hypothetical protein
MWRELGRAMRMQWAMFIWGPAVLAANQHLDFGSFGLFHDGGGAMTWIMPQSMN